MLIHVTAEGEVTGSYWDRLFEIEQELLPRYQARWEQEQKDNYHRAIMVARRNRIRREVYGA